jgi:hypothetical protein
MREGPDAGQVAAALLVGIGLLTRRVRQLRIDDKRRPG